MFVTGGNGFIGTHLIARLSQLGARVYALSRQRQPRRQEQPCLSSTVHWLQGDLVDLSTATALLNSIRPDIIFHLASHVVGARTSDAIIPTFQCNLMTTVNLLTAAREVGCARFILSGSQEEPTPGSSEMVPCSPYAASKVASSAYARMFHALYRLPVVILRIFMVYGPAQRDQRKLIPYVIRCLLKAEAPKLASGERLVDWVYVSDVVEGLLASAYAHDVAGKTIDIGSGELVSVRSAIDTLVHLIGNGIDPLYGAIADRPLERVRVADTRLAQELLRWSPRVRMNEGLRDTIAWYERTRKSCRTEIGVG